MTSDNDLIRRGDAIQQATRWLRGMIETDTIGGALKAIPAVQMTVKPGEIERAVWSAMIWAADYESNGVPEYTDCGNSFAETECRRAAARIRSALTTAPTPDAVKVAALVEAACGLLEACSAIFRLGNTWGDKLRAAIAAMKEQ